MLFDKRKTYIMDGAMGTEIQRRGFATTLPLWSAKALFDNPLLVKNIHKDYIKAGANIIVTCTFRTQKRTLAKAGLAHETKRINKLAVRLAQEARHETNTDSTVLIAASITTLEDCYEPSLVPPDDVLEQEHSEHIALLAQQPVDILLLETFNTIREARAAARAAEATGLPFLVSFVLNSEGALLSGETLTEVMHALDPYHPQAYGVNCVPTAVATKGLEILLKVTEKPLAVFANGDGEAGSDLGWTFNTSNQLTTYVQHCHEWKKMGATIIGGCCGTTPEYTEKYSEIVHK